MRRFTHSGLRFKLTDAKSYSLGYFGHREYQKLIAINDVPQEGDADPPSGLATWGEFGINLRNIFDPSVPTEFRFSNWTTMRGRPAVVYSYSARAPLYEVSYWIGERLEKKIVALRGEVVFERGTYGVLHASYVAHGIPHGFRIQHASSVVDYDYVEIGGRLYLLPTDAVSEQSALFEKDRNEVKFHSYRKFTAETSITFIEPKPDR